MVAKRSHRKVLSDAQICFGCGRVEGLLFNRLSISLKYESHTTEKTVFIDSDHTQWVGAVQLWF